MRVVIIGFGVQGKKRKLVAAESCVATIDPKNSDADFRSLDEVSDDQYDAALVCVPDSEKEDLIHRLVEKGKSVLVEKPLTLSTPSAYATLERLALTRGVTIYVAYNHRFEPHLVEAKEILAAGTLGKIYRCNLFYGNGTAALVRQSPWRDSGSGVLGDLGSHVLDLLDFWFERDLSDLNLISAARYENYAPDHAVMSGSQYLPDILCEVSMVSWRNYFEANIIGEQGSLHVRSLCKWSESELIVRTRVLPSGEPSETRKVVPKGDPTWQREFQHFANLFALRHATDLQKDFRINVALSRLAVQAERGPA